MMRDEIIAAHSIDNFVSERGHKLTRAGENFVTNGCANARHKPGHLPVTLDTRKQVWHCNDCNVGGPVIDWIMYEKNVPAADALRILGGGRNGSKLIAAYDYTNERGELLYPVCRFHPKNFRQRRPRLIYARAADETLLRTQRETATAGVLPHQNQNRKRLILCNKV